MELSILKCRFYSVLPHEWQAAAKAYFLRLDTATIVDEVLYKAMRLDTMENQIVLLNSLPDLILDLPEAIHLLEWMKAVGGTSRYQRLTSSGVLPTSKPIIPDSISSTSSQSITSQEQTAKAQHWKEVLI